MANEDNRVSNLIGLPIPDWALKQLETRSKQNSLNTRSNGIDNSNIVYLANKTGWIRLISSVDIKSPEVLSFLDKNYGIKVGDGPDLAKNFVLSGGTLAYNNGNFSLRSGLDSYSILGNKEISAYGFRPMPGITGVSIKTLGKLGSFRQAEVKFKALDKYQLDIIDMLYLRLGYTMFLEWGQTFYYQDGNDTLQKTENYSIDAFKKDLNKDGLRREIANNIRKTEGNYDAMLGMVTNFNFTMTQDGGYDCSLTLTSIGILGDSTRINVYANLNAKLEKEIKNLVSIITQLWKAQKQKEYDDQQRQLQAAQQAVPTNKELEAYPACVRSRGTMVSPDVKNPKNIFPETRALSITVNGTNYFFYPSKKYQTTGFGVSGVYDCGKDDILIDGVNENLRKKTYKQIIESNKDFIGFLYAPYSTTSPLSVLENGINLDRLRGSQDLTKSYAYEINVANKDYLAFNKFKAVVPKMDLTDSINDVNVQAKLAFSSFVVSENVATTPITSPTTQNQQGLFAYADNTQKVLSQKKSADLLTTSRNVNTSYGNKDQPFPGNAIYTNQFIRQGYNQFDKNSIKKNKIYFQSYVQYSNNVANNELQEYFILFSYSNEASSDDTAIKNQSTSPETIKQGSNQDVIHQKIIETLNNSEELWQVIRISKANLSDPFTDQNKRVPKILITLEKTIAVVLPTVVSIDNGIDPTKRTGQQLKTDVTQNKTYTIDLRIDTTDIGIISGLDIKTDLGFTIIDSQILSNLQNAQAAAAALGQPVFTPPSFDLDAIQQDNSLKYRSAIEIMLRILQVHTYEQASKKFGTSLISGDLTQIHTESAATPVTKKLYDQLFLDGIFGGILDDLLKKKVHPTKAEYEAPNIDKKNRFKYDAAYGFHRGLLSDKVNIPSQGIDEFQKKYLVDYEQLMKTYLVPYKQSQDLIQGSNLNYPVYISLGFFIMMLNHISTLYVNDDEKGVRITTDIPLYYIDFNPENNFCLSNSVQFTTNPYSFLIPMEGKEKDYKALFPKNVSTKKFWNTDSGDTLSKKIPTFRVSSDSSNNLDSYRGKIMNVLVSIDYLLQIISTHTAKDSTNSVYLKPMLEEVISDINKTFGNFNMLRLGYDDSADCFFISDDQLIPDKSMITADQTIKAEIPVYGKDSIAKSFDMKTEVSSKLANVLAISANSDAASQANGGTDGSSFGVYNVSYSDRYKKIVTSKNDNQNTLTGSNEKQDATAAQYAAELFDNSVKRYYNISDNINSTSENMISHTVNYYIELMAKSKNESEATRGSAMIPLSLNLSMDGMSGLGIGQAFTINEKLLPYRYTSLSETKNRLTKVGFIITGLDHEFSSNVWTTSIRTSMYFLKNIGDYSPSLNTNRPSLDTIISTTNNYVNNTPWSAAFISYIMTSAGFSTFPVSAKHVEYLNSLKSNADFQMLDPNDTKVQLQVGDLVAYNRNNNTNTYNTFPWSGDSHVNIVVDVVGTKVNVIGGNVSQKVAYDNSYENGKSKPNVFVIVRPNNNDISKKAADIAKQQRNSWLNLIETQADAKVFLRDYYKTVNLTLP